MIHSNTESEGKLHSRCTQWFWNTFISHRRMLIHVDNNSHNAIEGNRKKAMGVVKGVSDLILFADNGVTIFIELKTKTGAQRPEQHDFQEKVEARGFTYVIIRTFEEFQNLIYATLGSIK